MNKKEIILKFPIPVKAEGGGEVEISKISLGRLKAKHLKLLPKDFMKGKGSIEPSEIIPLIAGLADITNESADEIDIEDLMIIGKELESFLAQSHPDGKN